MTCLELIVLARTKVVMRERILQMTASGRSVGFIVRVLKEDAAYVSWVVSTFWHEVMPHGRQPESWRRIDRPGRGKKAA